jgi:hypothetical protein
LSSRGAPTNLKSVLVERHTTDEHGKQSNRQQYVPLLVTKNLWDFVMTLRDSYPEHHDRWFWADQISIDQSSETERNHQIALMSRIYSDAEFVIAFLTNDFVVSEELRNKVEDWAIYWENRTQKE